MNMRSLFFVAAAAIAAAPLACQPSSNSAGNGAGPGGAAGQAGSGGQAGAAQDGGGGSMQDGGGGMQDGGGGSMQDAGGGSMQDAGGGTAGSDAGGSGSDAGGAGGGPGAGANNCTAPTGTPVVHDTDITQDEIWKADSVQVVQGSINVNQGATLTIEPCTVVEIAAREDISVDGELDALGTAGQPVTFKRHDSTPWAYLAVNHGGKMKLSYASLQGGGSDTTSYSGATIVADGSATASDALLEPMLSVDHVSVKGSVGYGLWLRGAASFTSGSTGLLVTGAGAADSTDPFPMEIQAKALGSVPDGRYTGNAKDAIGVDTTSGAEVTADTTVHDRGVPYDVGGVISAYPPSSGTGPTLTFEPGIELDFEAHGGISATGAGTKLVLAGTAAKPISAKRAGTAAWDNIDVERSATASLSYVTLDGGGGDQGSPAGASLVVWGSESAPLVPAVKVDHVTIQNSAGYGALVGRYDGFTSDSTALTIKGCGKVDSAAPRVMQIGSASMGTVPAGSYTGNADDRIEVVMNNGADIDTSMTVPDPGVPYYFNQGLTVDQGSASSVPKLTLDAGVQFQFDPGANFKGNLFLDISQGSLEADGTAQKPVVFSSAAKTPARGDWVGVEFDPHAAGLPQKLDHTIVADAGAGSGVASYTCDPTVNGNQLPENAGILIYGWAPSSEFVTNTQVKLSGGHGIVRGWDLTQGPAVDFTPTNTFDPAPGGYLDQTYPPNPNATPECPY